MSLASQVVSIAKGEVGYHEGRSGGHWNNHQKYSDEVPGMAWSDYQAWCATFVSWVAMKAGASSLYPRTASCLVGVSWFKKAGRFSEYPAVGAQIFFGPGGGSHTGLVYDYDDTYVFTVEGNTNTNGSAEGDGVYLKRRLRRDSYVYGYGYPAFPDGIVSADPKYAADKPADTADKAADKPADKPDSHPARYQVVIDGRTYGYGAYGQHVTEVGKALVAKGFGDHYKSGPGPRWTDADTLNYQEFQRSLGLKGKDADGVPGQASLHKLFGRRARPVVDLSKLVSAAKSNPPAKGTPVTYSGVRTVEDALVREGLLSADRADGHYGSDTVSAYAKWQKRCGYTGKDADGIPGATTLKRLAVKHGFTVVG